MGESEAVNETFVRKTCVPTELFKEKTCARLQFD